MWADFGPSAPIWASLTYITTQVTDSLQILSQFDIMQ